MAKKTTKKTRMSFIVDKSTMGLTLGMEIEVSEYIFHSLKYALYKAHKKGIPSFDHVSVNLGTGNHSSFHVPDVSKRGRLNRVLSRSKSVSVGNGAAVYYLRFLNKDGSENTIQYELRHSNSKYFINVSGNPSCLVVGSNDIPALIKDSNSEENYNAQTVTFKYMNRIMYSILDQLLESYGFLWDGEDKKHLVSGDINIQSYQVAWYSGSFGEGRDEFQRYLKISYASLDALVDSVDNIADALDLKVQTFPKNNNLQVEARSGDKNRLFTLTWYTKDTHPDYKGDKDRLKDLIRWDCTLNNRFLANNKIKKICDLEALYIRECEKHGYDIGYVRFIADKVSERLKINHILSINGISYRKSVKALEEVTNKYEKLLGDNWLERGPTFHSFSEASKHFGLAPSQKNAYYEAKKRLLEFGVDVDIPRRYYAAVIDARIASTRSEEEREANVTNRHNQIVPSSELFDREIKRNERLVKLNHTAAMTKIRKFKPVVVTPQQFWIFNIEVGCAARN